jgi:hypothetical protein
VSIRIHAVDAPGTAIARTRYGLFGSGIFSRSLRRNVSGIAARNSWAF